MAITVSHSTAEAAPVWGYRGGMPPFPRRRLAVAGATGLIGAQVVGLAEAAGHEVVPLSRTHGVDLTDPAAIGDRLAGVDAVIDVTRSPAMARADAIEFFTTVATNLGRAARAAGVGRSVVLSIVGIDHSQDVDWYVATLAHERAFREQAPGTRVLRATQFFEFPGQVLQRAQQGGRARIMDMPTQPIASPEVARMLVEMATDDGAGDLQIAGPRRERLPQLVRRLIELRGEDVEVDVVPAPASIARGSVLPGPDALILGEEDWETWARRTIGTPRS